jgi:hypothetical protein
MGSSTLISLVCNNCGTSFYKYPYQVKQHNFCSKDCRLKWFGGLNAENKRRTKLICEWCGKEFEIKTSRLGRNDSKHKNAGRFCSDSCRNEWHSGQLKTKNPFLKIWLQMSEQEKLEYAETMRLRHKGRKYPPEVNKKKGRPGDKNPFWGKEHSPGTCKLIGLKARERNEDPNYRSRVAKAVFLANKKKPNKDEIKLGGILELHFPGEWKYTGDGYHIIGGYVPDYSNCNGHKAVIELFGKFWHTRAGIPFHYTYEGRMAAYKSLGYPCLIIWDYELNDETKVVTKVHQFIKEERINE